MISFLMGVAIATGTKSYFPHGEASDFIFLFTVFTVDIALKIWWGSGIQRGYGLLKGEKRWSLFNVKRWAENRPACCHVVPELWRGIFDTFHIEMALSGLKNLGSQAAPGFMKPEGVVVYHVAGNIMFKKTIEKDDEPKGKQE